MELKRINEFIKTSLVNSTQMAYVEEAYGTHSLLGNLNEVFRYISGNVQLVTLQNELDILEKFIGIERIRYGDRFDVYITNESRFSSVFIPKLSVIDFFDALLGTAMEENEYPVQFLFVFEVDESVKRIRIITRSINGESCQDKVYSF